MHRDDIKQLPPFLLAKFTSYFLERFVNQLNFHLDHFDMTLFWPKITMIKRAGDFWHCKFEMLHAVSACVFHDAFYFLRIRSKTQRDAVNACVNRKWQRVLKHKTSKSCVHFYSLIRVFSFILKSMNVLKLNLKMLIICVTNGLSVKPLFHAWWDYKTTARLLKKTLV